VHEKIVHHPNRWQCVSLLTTVMAAHNRHQMELKFIRNLREALETTMDENDFHVLKREVVSLL